MDFYNSINDRSFGQAKTKLTRKSDRCSLSTTKEEILRFPFN